MALSCIISSFYIKPQRVAHILCNVLSCIISSFYIKPQLVLLTCSVFLVVFYLNSTSNHNINSQAINENHVVLYLHSTSNHNPNIVNEYAFEVVLYLHSTSNHNNTLVNILSKKLYYIFILHQTTTHKYYTLLEFRCIISSFYIKPQLT